MIEDEKIETAVDQRRGRCARKPLKATPELAERRRARIARRPSWPRRKQDCSMPRPRCRMSAAGWRRKRMTRAPMPRPPLRATCCRWPTISRAARGDPAELRDDELKALVTGIEATERELERSSSPTASPASPRWACRSIPTSTRRCSSSPATSRGTVVQEMQPGYMIKDRLLRPAMVGVAKKPD